MRHWSLLAIRNWRARQARTLGAVLAIALGTAAVVWVTCCYESVRRTISSWAADYIGTAHITVSAAIGKYDQIPQRIVRQLAQLKNVEQVTPRLVQRLRAAPWPAAWVDRDDIKPIRTTSQTAEIDVHGIDLSLEFAVRTYEVTEGRMLEQEDELACVLEADAADETELKIGDYLLVWTETQERPHELKIVGFFERKRIGRLQKPMVLMRLPMLQRIRQKFTLITSADVTLKNSDKQSIQVATNKIRALARRIGTNVTVRSVESRMRQIEKAQEQQQFVVVLLSCIAMLTALFIILSTLSMGMIERIGQLGLMRCVGTTRWQLATLVMLEVFPLGLVGVAAGIPIGLAFTQLTVLVVPDYVGTFAISWPGIALAAAAGLVTTVLAGVIPATAALGVSPMEAAHPRAHRARDSLLVIAGVFAISALLVQHWVVLEHTYRSLYFVQYAAAGIILLYIGYAMLAPVVVRLIGSPAVVVAAASLRVRTKLLQDQVGRDAWRSAGICCGLMVGLSLIVGITVVNDSVTRGWQFPKEFPEAYLWSFEQFTPLADELIRDIPGIKEYTVANSINVIVEERPRFFEDVLLSVTWFLGCDPDTFLELVKLDFLEGDLETARQKLKEGGYVIIADDFARSRNKALGDPVKIWHRQSGRWHTFRVAGVVRSPSIDIAAGFFQLQSEYGVAAAGSVMGTNADLKKHFNVNGAKLVLLNFDLPPEPLPADWPPAKGSPAARRADPRDYDERVPLARRWRTHRERAVLAEIRRRLGAPQVYSGTVGELKDMIDSSLTEMTRLFSAIPGVALIVAAVGVANLMTANVFARMRQLAILRAVGATRGLIMRLVIGEALVLGLLGSGLGIGLGLHLAYDVTELIDRMWGFHVAVRMPWNALAFMAALTIGLCMIAGLVPARYAARSNVVDALHVA